jgi:hypothetical protein
MPCYKGVMYWPTFGDARAVRDALIAAGIATARVVAYQRGYAVQLRKSGTYV